MKSISGILILLIVLMGISASFSCRKILDKLKRDPVAVIDGCNIKQIVHYDKLLSAYRNIDFTYNVYGQPISVLHDIVGTGAPNLYFRYDKKRRLTDYIGLYTDVDDGNSEYEFWFKYFYDKHNRIIRDTQWVFGTLGQVPDPDSYIVRVSSYTYDIQNRLSSRSTTEIHPVVQYLGTVKYSYDAAGNRGSGNYDNKLNFRRTNKVWMFLEANYSINNIPSAKSYNSSGLPGEFDTDIEHSFLGFELSQSTIKYFCD